MIKTVKLGIPGVEVSPLFLLLLPVMFLAGYGVEFSAVFATMLLHELGHVAAAVLAGGKVYAVKILPVGLNATIEEGACDRWGRIIIYFSGPCVNLLLCVLCLGIDSYYLPPSDNMRFFISINIYLAIFNMVPLLPLDGGKMLRELLAARIGLFLASSRMRKASAVLSAVLMVFGIIQLIQNTRNFSLLIIGVYIFFSLKSEETEAAFMNVKDIIYRRSRLLKKGIYPARDLVVIKSMRLSEVIKSLDFDRFHIIHVLDDDLKLVKIVTEQELIDSVLKHNAEATFEELIKTGAEL